MHVTKLRIQNFKSFGNATFDLRPFNVIVGANNSGKSTLLQAMSLLQFCIRSTLRKKNSSYELTNISLGQEEFAVIPVADPVDLWKDRKNQKGGKHVKIEIEAELSSGAIVLFSIDLTFNRFGIQPELRKGTVQDLVGLNIVFVPGYAGVLPREERRTPAVRQSLLAQGRHGDIIRNILLDLKDAPEAYAAFQSLLRAVFPDIEITDPVFDQTTDLYIQVRYLEDGSREERKRKGQKGLDLISAGSGFHQFLQIFSNVLKDRPTTLLLDEPDAHLYAGLQKEILRILHLLVHEQKVDQILVATHSSELITRMSPNEIILLESGQPRRLAERADIPPVLADLGSVDNLALLKIRVSGRVVITEAQRDGAILEHFLRTLWGEDRYRRFASKVVFLPLNGSPLNRDVSSIQRALQVVLGQDVPVSVFVVSDRDYRFEQDRQEKLARGNDQPHQQWTIWERAEIENYLVNLAPLLRLCQRKSAGTPLFAVSADEVRAKLEECIERSRTVVLDKMMNRIQEQDRKQTAATCRRKAEEFLAQEWRGDKRLGLCDAKDEVLPCLRDWLHSTFSISISDARLAEEFREDELPAEVKQVAQALWRFTGLELDP